MRRSLLWKLLGINLVVVGIAVVLAARTIGQLVEAIFTNLMQEFHIQVDVMHQLFVANMARSLVLASLVAGAFGLVLSLVLFRMLVRPIRGMMTMAERIAAGDYAARARVASADEIGRLGESLNRMAGALETLERLRKDLVANVAHELRTPLANLQGYLEAIDDGVAPASAETIEALHEETMRLVRLVDALHNLSLFDARLSRIAPAPVELAPLIARSLHLRHAEFSGRGIAVRSEVPANCTVQADLDLLSQALHNLIDNALKYTSPGGEVLVRVVPEEGVLRIAVTNTGDGIASDDLPHIFERFYRGEKSRSRETGGAGIGLSIVKEVARIHGGQVGAESNRGLTTVWLVLPPRSP